MSNTNGHFTGYHENNELPIRKGDKVRISKGDLIFRMGEGLVEAKRSYTVTVDHILPGSSIYVGYVVDGELHVSWMSNSDLLTCFRLYGTDDLTKIWPILQVKEGRVFLPTTNPEVVWAGTGGYWTSSDINQVRKVG